MFSFINFTLNRGQSFTILVYTLKLLNSLIFRNMYREVFLIKYIHQILKTIPGKSIWKGSMSLQFKVCQQNI